MKVALAGPSGTGKTTLARFISSNTRLEFKSNSAQHLFTEEDLEVLRSFGWKETGHKEVIQLSMKNHKFAGEFQRRLLLRRGEFLEQNDDFIIDRSPLDNLAYFMYQSSFLATSEFIAEFADSVTRYLEELDVLIFIPTNNIGGIEENGSRVANYRFQRMISNIFSFCLEEFRVPAHTYVEVVNFWDLSARKKFVMDVINAIDYL